MRIAASFSPAAVLAASPAGGADTRPTALCDGKIYNAVGVAAELGLAAGCSVEEVVAAAYRAWGKHMLPRLRGRFVVHVWDPATATGLVGTDHLGAGSLFFCEQPRRLIFASEIGSLLDLLERRPEPDEPSLVHWLVDGTVPRGRTLYAGVRRLEGGRALQLDRLGWSEYQYWSPRYEGTLSASQQELAGLLREQVSEAVERRAPVGETAGTLLSGGLDSSSIAALVHRKRDARGYSLLFPEHPSVDESGYVAHFTQELELPWTRVVFRHGGSLLRPALEFLQEWEWPSVSPALVSNLAIARVAAEDGVGVLLDGEGGDELFGAPAYLLADAIRKGRLLQARALAVQLAGLGDSPPRQAVRWLLREYGLKGLLPHSIHKLARRRSATHYSPSWLRESAAEHLVAFDESWAWKRGPEGPTWWKHRVDQMTGWLERLGTHDYLRRKSAMAGVSGGHPFQDDVDLLAFCLRLPPETAFDAHLNRPLFRESMAGLVPDAVRLRPDKSTFNEFLEASLVESDRTALERLLLTPESELRAYLDRDVLERHFFSAARSRSPGWASVIWRLATAESWLRAQEDAGFTRRALDEWGLDTPEYVVRREPSSPAAD